MNEAQKCGAVAFLVEEINYDFDGMQILVEDTRKAMSIIAKNFYCSKKTPKIIGITGTNGKTTTTNMVAHILKCAKKKVGLIGTEGIFYSNKKITLHMTTPDPLDLFKCIEQMAEDGVEYVVMEVSAHAIYLNKIFALDFFVKALTNITEDHLDFFETFAKYKNTKVDFVSKGKGIKIVNIDDKYGCAIASKNADVFTYSKSIMVDACAKDITDGGRTYNAKIFNDEYFVQTNLIGGYNIENALCAMLIANRVGIKNAEIVNALNTFKAVDGRLNVYKKNNKFVVIDFAHTPDAIQKVLGAVKEGTQGKVVCVFGCGGNRDAQKRSIMGQVATENADFVCVTSDNPRFEEPQAIASQIISGIKKDNYRLILDRKEAIIESIQNMQDGDCVVICGKGAEDYMEVKGIKYAYSDRAVVESMGFEQI